ncbi:MAG: diphthine synthase [Thermoprotei archaeon]
MGILYLVGLGLSWKLTTPLALEVLKGSDVVYFDTYTSFSCDITHERLSSMGINVVRASRKDLENEYKKVIALLDEGKKVAIASVGDPIIATTHEALAIEAAKRGHKVKVIPGVSVLCYFLSKSGLSSYKLGRSVTVTFPENVPSETPYRVLKANDEQGLHTVMFLDIRNGRMMTSKEAISILASLEEKFKEGVVTPERIVVIGQRLGCDDEKVSVMKVSEVPNSSLSDPPHILLFPSRRLHFVEEEGLQWLMRSTIE